MPQFVEPQLAKLVERSPADTGWVHEIKFDGYRLQMRVEGGEARLYTRKGLDWSDKFPALVAAGSQLPDGLVDGEVVGLNSHEQPDFAARQGPLSDGKTDPLIFFVFDILFASGEDLRCLPLSERKARLSEILKGCG